MTLEIRQKGAVIYKGWETNEESPTIAPTLLP